MPAGLVASSLQARIETLAHHAFGTAAEMLGDVNRALVATSDAGRFATLAYVELDGRTDTATFVNAGHLPILVLSPGGGAPQWIASTGPALGILPEARFEQQAIAMDPGTTIVVYSDGVTETCDQNGEEFGEARLLDAVTAHVADTPGGICQAVVDARRDFGRQARAADDVTVLVVKRVDRAAAHHE
jgi:sigma-B regulation protein RsbU (phosphoserine phosphatase)